MNILNFRNFYITVPKDSIIKDYAYLKDAIFVFNDIATEKFFLKNNNSCRTRQLDSLDINEVNKFPFIINNKSVYYEYVIPKLINKKVDKNNIFIYEDIEFIKNENILKLVPFKPKKDKKITLEHKQKLYNKIKSKYASKLINSCPICHCDYFLPIFNKNTYVGKNGKTKEYLFDTEIKQLFCKNCGLIYINRVFENKFYFEYLNSLYSFDIKGVQEYSSYKSDIRVSLIEKYIANKEIDKVLEVGSFDGKTLYDIKNRFSCMVRGIEPLTNCAEESIKNFPELESSIENTTFELCIEDYDEQDKYDVVVFTFAFRHIINPKNTASFLQKIVSKDGLLIIDEGSLIDDGFVHSNIYDIKGLYYVSKNYYYSMHHFIYLLGLYGFEFVAYERNVLGESVRFYTGLVFKYTGKVVNDIERLQYSFLASLNSLISSKLLMNETDSIELYKDVIQTVRKK